MSSLRENDTTPDSLRLLWLGTPDRYAGDPNPYFGYVVYAGARGGDQGLAVTRVNYVAGMDWNYYWAQPYATVHVKAPLTVMPFWNARGDAPQGW